MVEETIKETGERHGVVTRIAVQLGLGSGLGDGWVPGQHVTRTTAGSRYTDGVNRPQDNGPKTSSKALA